MSKTIDFSTILYQIEGGILTITLNRPEQMNAFTVQMADELIEAFGQASMDDDVRVIVVTGAGRAFCAGMDLQQGDNGFDEPNVFGLNQALQPTMQDMNERLLEPEIERGVRDTGGVVTLAIYDCNKPVIAAINGAAVGIGATMTCAMDIRLASEYAKIGFVFNKIGITPEACSSWFLPKVVGISQALEWTYTGDIMDAQDAVDGGLVKAVYKADDLLEEAYKIARKIARHSPISVALTRQMMYRNSAQNHPVEAHKVDSLAVFYTSQKDGREGVQSFLEKRAPEYQQKVSTDMPDFYPWWE